MNRRRTAIALASGMILSLSAHAEINPVNVRKVEQDRYQTADGSYIETKNCFVDAQGDNAVLNYEQYACTNNLRFISADQTCEVVFVFK
jgi:hypothetical protein